MKTKLLSSLAIGAMAAACAVIAAQPAALADTSGLTAAGGAPQGDALSWAACADTPGVQCTTVRVPVNWARPHGDQLNLRVGRIPAAEPRARIGSLLILPGGPGVPGVSNGLPLWANDLSAEVRRRFDLVTLDPRGTGASQPLPCPARRW